MKKFEGILICTDLDGTLLKNDKSISEKNLDAIKYFMNEGGLFTFVTGRMPMSARRVYSVIRPNAAIGCINGGGLFDTEKMEYLWLQELPREALRLVQYIDERFDGIGIQINTANHIYFSRENEAMELFRKATGDPNLVKHYNDIDASIAKVIFGDTREGILDEIAKMLESHPLAEKFCFIRSDKMLHEILPKGINKGVSLNKLCEFYGIDKRRSVAVGDYENDVEMINAAGLGIAVANATQNAKAAADLITVSNEEDAIAKIIYDIDCGNIKI